MAVATSGTLLKAGGSSPILSEGTFKVKRSGISPFFAGVISKVSSPVPDSPGRMQQITLSSVKVLVFHEELLFLMTGARERAVPFPGVREA